MAKKPTVTTVASGYYGRQALNDNFEALRDAFDNTLSRDGSTPNAMGADLDMNSNDILNVQNIDVQGLRINGVLIGSSDVVAAGANLTSDDYTGDGSTVTYAMTYNPFTKDNTQVYIDGVYQNKSTYSISGLNLTFSEAPPLNSAIEIIVARSLDTLAGTDASNVTYTQSGSATQTTVEAKLQETVSVKDFGAVGDGVTDDTAAFQAAVAASSSVFIPHGTYVLSSTLSLPNGCSIVGETMRGISGSYPTQIISSASVTAIKNDTSATVYISNIRLTGQTSASGSGTIGLNIYVSGGSVVENCYVETFEYGILAGRIQNCHFKNITIGDCNKGFYSQWNVVDAYTTVSSLEDVYIAGGSVDGFYLRDVNTVTMKNCSSDGTANALQIINSEQVHVDTFYTELGTTTGLYAVGSDNIKVENTNLYGPASGNPSFVNLVIEDCQDFEISKSNLNHGGATAAGHINYVGGANKSISVDVHINESPGILGTTPPFKFCRYKQDNDIPAIAAASTTPAYALLRYNGATDVIDFSSASVSGVTKTGTGLYTVNFVETLANTNYIVVITGSGDDTVLSTVTYGTSGFNVKSYDISSAAPADTTISIVVFAPNR